MAFLGLSPLQGVEWEGAAEKGGSLHVTVLICGGRKQDSDGQTCKEEETRAACGDVHILIAHRRGSWKSSEGGLGKKVTKRQMERKTKN